MPIYGNRGHIFGLDPDIHSKRCDSSGVVATKSLSGSTAGFARSARAVEHLADPIYQHDSAESDRSLYAMSGRDRLNRRANRERRGLTVTEVLVVVSIASLLLALVLPAIGSSRASARRLECVSRLRQIGLAAATIRESEGRYPSRDRWNAYARPLIEVIENTEYLEEVAAARRLSETPVAASMSVWLCPSDELASLELGHQNYLMCRGRGGYSPKAAGMLPYSRQTQGRSHVPDGQSQTVLFSERLIPHRLRNWPPWSGPGNAIEELRAIWYSREEHPLDDEGRRAFADDCAGSPPEDLPGFPSLPIYWGDYWGYNHSFGPNRRGCFNGPPPIGASHRGPEVHNASRPASSRHVGGVNALYVDGHVLFLSNQVDTVTWAAAGTIDGDEIGGSW